MEGRACIPIGLEAKTFNSTASHVIIVFITPIPIIILGCPLQLGLLEPGSSDGGMIGVEG